MSTKDGTTAGGSESKRVNLVKNVCITDAVTGDVVFERVYKWKESSAFSNLGTLIQVFYQFAREVDDGEISSINYESNTTYSGKQIKNEILQSKKDSQTMQMVSTTTKDVVISVFYDIQGQMILPHKDKEKLLILMHTIKAAFTVKYAAEFERRRKLANSKDVASVDVTGAAAETDSHTQKGFEDFTATVDKLRDHIFCNDVRSVFFGEQRSNSTGTGTGGGGEGHSSSSSSRNTSERNHAGRTSPAHPISSAAARFADAHSNTNSSSKNSTSAAVGSAITAAASSSSTSTPEPPNEHMGLPSPPDIQRILGEYDSDEAFNDYVAYHLELLNVWDARHNGNSSNSSGST